MSCLKLEILISLVLSDLLQTFFLLTLHSNYTPSSLESTPTSQKSQPLHMVWTLNLHQWYPLTKDDVIIFVAWYTCSLQTKNETKIRCPTDDYCWLQTLSDILRWQKNMINDVIMTVIWPGYNLHTRCKVGTTCNILGFSSTVALLDWRNNLTNKIIMTITWSG